VSRRSPSLLIIALLVFQLAFGVHWQTAHAAPVAPVQGMDAGAEHCADHHQLQSLGPDQGLGAQAYGHVPASPQVPVNKHDCCRSMGCQCHCAQSPAVVELPSVNGSLASVRVPDFGARNPDARTSEFFRPPIA
jgi:hypothetical protein